MSRRGRWEAYKGKGFKLGEAMREQGSAYVTLLTIAVIKDLSSIGNGGMAGIWVVKSNYFLKYGEMMIKQLVN